MVHGTDAIAAVMACFGGVGDVAVGYLTFDSFFKCFSINIYF